MLKLLKQYYLLITIIIFLSGLLTDYFTKEIIPTENLRSYIDTDNQLKTEVYFTYNYKYRLLNQLSQGLFALAISLFISLFILKSFEELERKEFELKLLTLQKNINKDVLNSVFEKFIHPKIFKTIKNDFFNYKTFRTNALWIFNFKENNGLIELTKTITYEVVNEQENEEIEEIILRDYQFNFYKAKVQYVKYQINDQFEEEDFKDKLVYKNKNLLYQKQIIIPPKSILKVTQIVFHEYSNSSIYGTFTTNHPIIGLKVICNIPQSFELHLFSTFKYHLNELTEKGSQEQIFFYDSAILSGQSLQFFLIKKDS